MTGFFITGLLLFAVLAVVGYTIGLYNMLVAIKNNVKKAWANIDVVLKQRHDEIPKLVKTCEGYMNHERETLAKVIALRNAATGASTVAEKAQMEGQLTAGLHKLFALAENYPDLKAQAGFMALQTRISELENQIADRREYYNESVNHYNTRIESFPDMILARMMALQAQELFRATEEDRADVDINFNSPK